MDLVTGALLLLGFGFLIANAKLAYDYVRFLRRRRSALLTWRIPKPPQYTFALGLGVALGLLVFVKLVLIRRQAFGEAMMFAYYAYFFPMSLTIGRGFYEDGIWADNAFIPYQEIGGISWREDEHQVSLVVISRLRNLARRLNVPGDKYGAARRLLRDKIGEHAIHFAGTGLDLGAHDERDEA
ncbi:MAG: hypothetical protein JWL71_2014 [Acidobacteria bacterium]|nr:hypothetical protein [Acidobacteriota bacterium]